MNVNLLLKELKRNVKGTIITGISAAIYIAFSFSIYSVMKDNIVKITEFYAFMPESFRLAFNMDLNQWDNVLGFYVTYFVYYVPIIAGCYSIILGMKIISKEEQFKTAEFLLSHPLSTSCKVIVSASGLENISLLSSKDIIDFAPGNIAEKSLFIFILSILYNYFVIVYFYNTHILNCFNII